MAGRPGLNERQRRVLVVLAQRGRITNGEYRALSGIANSTAYADLTDLVQKRLIEREGVRRGTVYRSKQADRTQIECSEELYLSD